MTITTQEELQAVPVGDSVFVQGNPWTRVADGFEREGIKAAVEMFQTDLNSNQIHREVTIEVGSYFEHAGYGQDRYSYLVSAQLDDDEWMLVVFNRRVFYSTQFVTTDRLRNPSAFRKAEPHESIPVSMLVNVCGSLQPVVRRKAEERTTIPEDLVSQLRTLHARLRTDDDQHADWLNEVLVSHQIGWELHTVQVCVRGEFSLDTAASVAALFPHADQPESLSIAEYPTGTWHLDLEIERTCDPDDDVSDDEVRAALPAQLRDHLWEVQSVEPL